MLDLDQDLVADLEAECVRQLEAECVRQLEAYYLHLGVDFEAVFEADHLEVGPHLEADFFCPSEASRRFLEAVFETECHFEAAFVCQHLEAD